MIKMSHRRKTHRPLLTTFGILLCLLLISIGSVAQAKSHGLNSEVRKCLRTHSVRFHGTIVDAAIATPELSTLVNAVTMAGLADALSQPGRLTVFAPTDEAFAAIPPELLNIILADPEGLLTSVLTYHVVPRRLNPKRTFRKRSATTLSGQKVFYGLSRSEGAIVNNSKINCRGVYTDNGVVWIIDSVLQPQFLQTQ